MKNKHISPLRKEIRKAYEKMQRTVYRSLGSYAKHRDELNTFLNHSLLGEGVREKIAREIFNAALKKQVPQESKKLPLVCHSGEHGVRVFRLLTEKSFVAFLKSEFGCTLDASRKDNMVIIECEA